MSLNVANLIKNFYIDNLNITKLIKKYKKIFFYVYIKNGK